ncbi:hypothetical protein AXF42_Ash016928 [Apostasia shenzhenica]|uniref:Uncharacterized protein n=1 Tax=Apostasia shenzhenica TaxID=1088818 RepID=A0A2H9ZRH9_9ASPA|nr:hypothetical protein AXF42_Ash016928 [Apostasia shenzhenica]
MSSPSPSAAVALAVGSRSARVSCRVPSSSPSARVALAIRSCLLQCRRPSRALPSSSGPALQLPLAVRCPNLSTFSVACAVHSLRGITPAGQSGLVSSFVNSAEVYLEISSRHPQHSLSLRYPQPLRRHLLPSTTLASRCVIGCPCGLASRRLSLTFLYKDLGLHFILLFFVIYLPLRFAYFHPLLTCLQK